MNNIYLCIDLKTFYASVECVERNLDPFTTNLVVADESRGKGTICLAISPKMKMLGIKNRCRLFEIPPNIKYIIAKNATQGSIVVRRKAVTEGSSAVVLAVATIMFKSSFILFLRIIFILTTELQFFISNSFNINYMIAYFHIYFKWFFKLLKISFCIFSAISLPKQ